MAALHLTIKINYQNRLGSKLLVKYCTLKEFTTEQIISMEFFLARTMRWYLHPPTTSEFAYSFTSLLPTTDVFLPIKLELWKRANYIIQASLRDAYFVPFQASSIALAIVINVVEDMKLHLEADELIAFFEKEIGYRLLRLNNGSEESEVVKLLRMKLREVSQRTAG